MKGVNEMAIFDQKELWDRNIFCRIAKCFITNKNSRRNEISVTYKNGYREYLASYDPTEYEFNFYDFVGMSKIEALFYIDRKDRIPQERKYRKFI